MRLLLALLAPALLAQSPTEHFERQVRPLLANRCQGCHNPKAAKAGLDLTTAAGLQLGADTGPVLQPKDLANSRILQVTSYLERIKMPPTGKLTEAELTTLRTWVQAGAPWPAEAAAPSVQPRAKGYSRAQKEFWSFRPLRRPTPPPVQNEAWVRTTLDRFILAALEAKQLAPAPPADKATLLRRATFDLTGLPPTPAETQAFLADSSPNAYANVIDRLLASPRYGEKWGRHWLDVARYADSTGADEDYRYPHAWRYRDYVINAFNQDLPYNQFLRDQIAGDLHPERGSAGIIATGFLALGPKLVAEQDKVKMFYDIVDEQIDVVGKAVLGLTLACARCHDHKFDPISIKDYYSLASIFASTKQLAKIEGTVSELYYAPLADPTAYQSHQKLVNAKQAEATALIAAEAKRYRQLYAPQMAAYMAATQIPNPALDPAHLARWAAYLKPTKERRPHLERWLASPTPATAAAYQADFEAEAARRAANPTKKFLAGDNRFYSEVASGKGPLTLPPELPETFYTPAVRQQLATLAAERKALQAASPPEPPMACAVAEDQPVDQRVFLRGSPDNKGEPVPKRFPVILAGEASPPIASVSGRRELAEWLASDQNSLPARVMANRLWQGHFSQGLVRTPNNFGFAGERPSHPELLDWLATELIAQGWSLKQMHRALMLSNTYQQSIASTPAKREKDPDNRLLSHFPLRRKTVEEIRDSLLVLDDSLDLTMGGSLQSGTGTDNEFSDGRKSIHPDASQRRTVYLSLRRSNLATLFTLFDFGDATTSTETRSETNVAPQALYMMNSPFVAARAAGVAKLLANDLTPNESNIDAVWLRVLGRAPTAEERRAGESYLATFPPPANPTLAWSSYIRSLIASNDFLYVY
jgi:hypothetical protein